MRSQREAGNGKTRRRAGRRLARMHDDGKPSRERRPAELFADGELVFGEGFVLVLGGELQGGRRRAEALDDDAASGGGGILPV